MAKVVFNKTDKLILLNSHNLKTINFQMNLKNGEMKCLDLNKCLFM